MAFWVDRSLAVVACVFLAIILGFIAVGLLLRASTPYGVLEYSPPYSPLPTTLATVEEDSGNESPLPAADTALSISHLRVGERDSWQLILDTDCDQAEDNQTSDMVQTLISSFDLPDGTIQGLGDTVAFWHTAGGVITCFVPSDRAASIDALADIADSFRLRHRMIPTRFSVYTYDVRQDACVVWLTRMPDLNGKVLFKSEFGYSTSTWDLQRDREALSNEIREQGRVVYVDRSEDGWSITISQRSEGLGNVGISPDKALELVSTEIAIRKEIEQAKEQLIEHEKLALGRVTEIMNDFSDDVFSEDDQDALNRDFRLASDEIQTSDRKAEQRFGVIADTLESTVADLVRDVPPEQRAIWFGVSN